MSESSDNLPNSSLTDKELLNQFKAIEEMQDNDKTVVKILIDAFYYQKENSATSHIKILNYGNIIC